MSRKRASDIISELCAGRDVDDKGEISISKTELIYYINEHIGMDKATIASYLWAVCCYPGVKTIPRVNIKDAYCSVPRFNLVKVRL
jgi:hypothetical protein